MTVRSGGRTSGVASHEFGQMPLAGRTFVRFGDWPLGRPRQTSRVASQVSRLDVFVNLEPAHEGDVLFSLDVFL